MKRPYYLTEPYDVAIVGARCAGASLAAFLARNGKRVALFDKSPLPSEYVMSTHTLHPPGMDVLDELGIGDRVREITPASHVIRFSYDGVAVDATFRDGRREYCPRRFRLDAALQDAAKSAGADLFDRTRVVDVLKEGGHAVGVRVRGGEGERDLCARIVVGADGRHSRIAECVGASEYLGYDAPRACYWTYWPAPACWRDKERFPFDMYFGRTGADFRAIFPTDDNQLLLATTPPVETARHWKRDLISAYRADLAEDPVIRPLLANNQPSEPVRGTISERYYFRDAAGPGWVLVGDAGHHKDFIIGDGITEALFQSRSLAWAIVDGTGSALQAWWRQRDVEALALFRFAQDQGLPGPPPKIVRRVFARLSRTPGGGTPLIDPLDRRTSPYESIPFPTIAGAVFDGVLAGEFNMIREFLAQVRRSTEVAREVNLRAALK